MVSRNPKCCKAGRATYLIETILQLPTPRGKSIDLILLLHEGVRPLELFVREIANVHHSVAELSHALAQGCVLLICSLKVGERRRK